MLGVAMRTKSWVGWFSLAASTILWGHPQLPQRQGEPRDQQQQQRQRVQPPKPTLGLPPDPSLRGPRTSNTTDPRKLVRVRTIYVERIDNSLNEKLVEGLARMGRFRVVEDRDLAEAVFRGSCFDSRRLKMVHSEVFLSERSSGASIWQDVIRRPYNPPPLEKVVDESATLILVHLRDSIKEAEHRR